jgi:hypothetical protein
LYHQNTGARREFQFSDGGAVRPLTPLSCSDAADLPAPLRFAVPASLRTGPHIRVRALATLLLAAVSAFAGVRLTLLQSKSTHPGGVLRWPGCSRILRSPGTAS